MSKKLFTDQEVKMLRDNQYTYAVTPHILSFTKEFKELFCNIIGIKKGWNNLSF